MTAPHIPSPQGREHAEPTENVRPVPWPMLALVAIMLVFGAVYIARSNANTPSDWGDGRTLQDLAEKSSADGQHVDGSAIYASLCAACHQATGSGLPGVFPPLAGSEWVLGKASTTIAIVLHGIQGDITVKGEKYSGVMPSFAAQLDDAQLAAVLTHLRSSWGNQADAVQPSTVKEVRESLKNRTSSFEGEQALKALP